MNPFRPYFEKVGAFIVRKLDTKPELLVYSARYDPDAPLQVPGGGVQDEEELEVALHREVKEETGFGPLPILRKIGVSETPLLFRPLERHCYLLDGSALPESFSHTVTGEGSDQGESFHFSWYRIDSGFSLGGDLGFFLNAEALPELYPAPVP